MRERLGKALILLQATPLPADLIDNPARTGQWLITLANLQRAVTALREETRAPNGNIAETRGERVMNAFNRLIDGLPIGCLDRISPVIKLGLIRPLLLDLEHIERGIHGTSLPGLGAFTARLSQYRTATAGMAARHLAPDPPLSGH